MLVSVEEDKGPFPSQFRDPVSCATTTGKRLLGVLMELLCFSFQFPAIRGRSKQITARGILCPSPRAAGVEDRVYLLILTCFPPLFSPYVLKKHTVNRLHGLVCSLRGEGGKL